VINVATLNVIRRWALRENMSIREISRRTGMARSTVKKYQRSDETEPTYAKRLSSSKLDPYAEKLATWLGMEATKSRKQRRNLKQIYTATSLKPETTVIGSKTALLRLNPRRRRSRTYPHREQLLLTKRVGQNLMERLGQGSAQFNRVSSSKLAPLCRKAGRLAGTRGNKISETAAQFEADLHKPEVQKQHRKDSTQEGKN
jgi:transcriptional regulator with XRE-family HTH domain